MAVGSKDLVSENLRGLDDDRLVDELRKAKEELFNLRFQSATGQLDNHGRLRAVRKDIARIYTELRERELGIGQAPNAPAKEELFNLRFQVATGQLDNNRRLQTVRRDIARIYTVMRERELGIVRTGGAA